jgi:anti-sigma-K factor RskA
MGMSSDSRQVNCGEDVAAYALGALEPEHARAFKRHLDDCELCSTDLATLRPAVAALPASAEPVDPPPHLKKRIMAVVEAEAKERREQLADAPRSRWRRLADAPLLPRAGALAAAAAAVVLAVIMVTGGSETTVIEPVAKPPGADVELRMEDGKGTLVVEGMLQPDQGRVYQVWKKRGNAAPEPTDALFTPRSDGHASVAVPGDLKGVDQVLVSAEPPGGSRRPTTAAAIVVET